MDGGGSDEGPGRRVCHETSVRANHITSSRSYPPIIASGPGASIEEQLKGSLGEEAYSQSPAHISPACPPLAAPLKKYTSQTW